MISADDIQDCGGLCFPDAAGQTIDFLRSCEKVATAARAAALVTQQRAQAAGHDAVLLGEVEAALARVRPDAAARLFMHPLAALDAPVTPHDEMRDARSPRERAKAIARHLVGHADGPPTSLVFDADTIGSGLYLPHLGITVLPAPDTVVAIRQDAGLVRILRSDGQAVTLPKTGMLPTGLGHPMIRVERRVGPFAVLNDLPEVQATFRGFLPAQEPEADILGQRLAAGIALLQELWPSAADSLSRHVTAVVLLQTRAHERSHSPVTLAGAILLTASSPVTVGDLLCHEASHVRMHWLQRVGPLLTLREPALATAGFPSPWRSDRRPIDGLLLGVHAFLNVCEWYRRVEARCPSQSGIAHLIRHRQAANVWTAFETLNAAAEATRLSAPLMKELRAAVRALRQSTSERRATHV